MECLITKCKRKERKFGLCLAHYDAAIEKVRRGETHGDHCVALGLVKTDRKRPISYYRNVLHRFLEKEI